MPDSERAKQFSSFKALGGLDEALEKKRRELGYEERRILSDDDENIINETLSSLSKGNTVRVTYYNGKMYETAVFTVESVDEINKFLHTREKEIRFGNIYSIIRITEEKQ